MFTTLYLFALDGGTEVAENAALTTEAIVRGWSNVWQKTVVAPPAGGSYWQVVWVATWVATIGGTIFIFNRATRIFQDNTMSSGQFSTAFTYFLVPVLIWAGLNNHGALAADLSYSINRVILYSNESIMRFQIADTTFEQAIKGMNLTILAQNELRQKYEDCMNVKDSIPQVSSTESTIPLDEALARNSQFQCFNDFKERINELQSDFAARNCRGINAVACTGVFRLFTQAASAIGQGLEDALNQVNQDTSNQSAAGKAGYFFTTNIPLIIGSAVTRNVGDYMAGGTIHAMLKPVLYAFQFDYMNTLVGGMFLCGMSAPLAISASLIPFNPRTIWVWSIAFFSFGMAIFYYSVLIGTVAALIVEAEAETFTALQYAFFLGLFAPAISSTLALGGAWAAAQAAQANGHAIGAATFSVASSLVVSIMRFLPIP